MPANLPVPRKFSDLITEMDSVAAAFELLNQLQNLRVIARQADGTITTHAIQLSGLGAIIDLTQGTFLNAAPASAPAPTTPNPADAKSAPTVAQSV